MNDNIKILLLDEFNENHWLLWENSVKEITESNFFHTKKWLIFVKKYFNINLKKLIIYKSNVVVAIFPFYEKSYKLLNVAGSPLYLEGTPYMGIAIDEKSNKNEIIQSVDKFLKNKGIGYFRSSLDNDFLKDIFIENGYSIIEKISYRIDLLPPVDTLWGKIGKSGRAHVKRAEKNGFVYEELSEIEKLNEYVNEYYKMIQDVFFHKGLPPYIEKKYFIELFKLLISSNIGKIYVVRDHDGLMVAGLIVVYYKNRAYGLDSASLKRFQRFGINNFLRWHTIINIKNLGIRSYDLTVGGIKGLDSFKKSFGALPCKTIYIEKNFSFSAKFYKKSYSIVKKIHKKIKIILK